MTFNMWIDAYYNITEPDKLPQEKLEEYEDKYEGECLVWQWTPQYL